jgi:glycosyltransferase involved in cell wall biosynthesis
MAMATPVIATNVGGVAEVVRDGVDGLVLAPGDPARWAREVDALLANPDRRRAIGASARERAIRDFSPGAHVEGVLAAYERAIANHR